MGRKTKYSHRVVEAICEAIASNGGDESGWVAGGISEPTFYSWLAKYPEFLESVESARSQFRKNASEHLQSLASKRLKEALSQGQTITWNSQKTTRREHWLPGVNGEPDRLRWYQIDREETTHQEHRPTPQWAIERVVPKPLHTLEQLIAIAGEYGLQLVIKDEDLFNRYLAEISSQNQDDKGTGLTEEAAAEIRRKILGM